MLEMAWNVELATRAEALEFPGTAYGRSPGLTFRDTAPPHLATVSETRAWGDPVRNV